jgi:small subunit ribosomal protein S8
MMNDRIADFLTRIRNAQRARHQSIRCHSSNALVAISEVLEKEGYIRNHRVEEDNGKRNLVVELKYFEGAPVIKRIDRVSTCGLRKYTNVKSIPKHYNGLGISIVSTNKGVMSDFEARQKQVGGEILCTVY